MNGQMKRYKESLKNTPKPILPSQLQRTKLDLKGLLVYAKSKNMSPALLTDSEKAEYLH